MLEPFGNKVVLRPLTEKDSERETESGIILPSTAPKTPDQQFIVVSIGPDVANKTLKVDDRVLVTSLTMKELFQEGNIEYSIIKETDIIGRI